MNNCQKLEKKAKIRKYQLIGCQLLLLFFILLLWELGSKYGLLDEFLFSRPSKIYKLFIKYLKADEIFVHVSISLYETILGIVIGSGLGILIASLLWYSNRLSLLLEPFLVVLNALPKTALAPIIIIWVGTGVEGIVAVSISILIIITILSTYNHFINVDPEKIKMMESFNANRFTIYTKLVFPSNLVNIINVIKINIGMSWIGVIVGEFLVSRAGIGYLIMYGGQVFRLDLVMMGVIILAICAFLMYKVVDILEKLLIKKRGKEV